MSQTAESTIIKIQKKVSSRISASQSQFENGNNSDTLDELRNQIEQYKNEINDYKERIKELEHKEGHKRKYHYMEKPGVFKDLDLSIRERIVVELAYYRFAIKDKDADMPLGRKSLIGNKKTVTDYLNMMKCNGKEPLDETELTNIRTVLKYENLDTSYVLDYLC